MIRIKSILMVASCSALLFAAGSGSGSDTNGSQSDGNMEGKSKITGTIQEIMPQDSMIVISGENESMLDTVKVTDKTKMDTNLDQLKKGDRVDVDVETKGEMKVAKRIRMGTSNGGNGSDKSQKKDSSGNHQSDTMPY